MGILKKTLLYFTAAVVLGLLITLIPLSMLTEAKTMGPNAMFTDNTSPERRPGYGQVPNLYNLNYSAVDFVVLAISFAVAATAYLLIKYRILR